MMILYFAGSLVGVTAGTPQSAWAATTVTILIHENQKTASRFAGTIEND